MAGLQALQWRLWLGYCCVFTVCLTATIVLVVSMDANHKGYWKSWTRDTSRDDGTDHFCEADRTENFVWEPSNSWSAFFYLLVGLYMIFCGLFDRHTMTGHSTAHVRDYQRRIEDVGGSERLTGGSPSGDDEDVCSWPSLVMYYPWASVYGGFINSLHAFGVFFNHGCRCSAGARFDVAGMNGAISFLAAWVVFQTLVDTRTQYTVHCCTACRDNCGLQARSGSCVSLPRTMAVVYVLLTVLYLFNREVELIGGAPFVLGLITAVLGAVLHYWRRPRVVMAQTKLLALAVGFLVVGIIVWYPDFVLGKCWVARDSLIQMHAIWHMFTAGALWLGYCYMRTLGVASPWVLLAWNTTGLTWGGHQAPSQGDDHAVPMDQL